MSFVTKKKSKTLIVKFDFSFSVYVVYKYYETYMNSHKKP
jgi:hypothetical protein